MKEEPSHQQKRRRDAKGTLTKAKVARRKTTFPKRFWPPEGYEEWTLLTKYTVKTLEETLNQIQLHLLGNFLVSFLASSFS